MCEKERFLGCFWDKLDSDIDGEFSPSCFDDLKWGSVDYCPSVDIYTVCLCEQIRTSVGIWVGVV
jgi:hypothetical protein